MKYIASAKVSELTPGAMKSVTVEGQQLLLANVSGNFYALAQKCPHMGANLRKGKLDGAVVTCPMHGAGFDVTSGAAVQKAKLLFLKMSTKDAKTFPVKIENGDVLIGL